MSRSVLSIFTLLFLSIFIISCQKELSFEQGKPSQGSLQQSNGECLPKNVAGTYMATKPLGDTNYIDVTVDVIQTGNYVITTDTINGYHFRGTGNFSTTGTNTVRLKAFGTPNAPGINDFAVQYDSTICFVPVTVIPDPGAGTSAFTLQGAGGDCTSSSVAGTYTQGTALTAANQVVLQVNVTAPGTWSVTTSTVTGFSFSGSGTFTTTGVQNITLNGAGTPTAAGAQTFSVSAGGGACNFVVTVNPNNAPPAVFSLQGAPGSCTNSVTAGNFTVGTPLNASNTITVQVNVTTVGSYTITTNTVAGMTFTASGTFTNTGVQNVTLNGSGTPTAAGTHTFTITAGTSNCTTTVICNGGLPPAADHFILTNNSWISYNTPVSATDTLKRSIVGSVTASGFTYKILKEKNVSGVIDDSIYIRKSGNNYYEFNFVDYYTSFYFDNAIVDSINFLKEGLTTGQTWSSPEYADSVSGVPTKVRYDYTANDANATVVLNGKTYNNVYKVTLKVMVNENNTGWQTDITWVNYYAAGIGWIYQSYNDGSFSYELPVRYYQVF